MKFIVAQLLNYMVNQIPKEAEKTLFRIDGFEDIRIYERLCKELHKRYFDSNKCLVAKLSREKWESFANRSDTDNATIQSMKANNWIATDNSLTFYRNLSGPNIIVLMGTEDVEDKGGLNDCYYINAHKIEADIKGQYDRVFSNLNIDWNDIEKKCVNKLYSNLFDLVPINIYKLSCMADEWKDIEDIERFVETFFVTLPKWGISFRKDVIPSYYQIANSSKNILQSAFDFIDRKPFKKMSQAQFKKYQDKIIKYDEQDEQYSSKWVGWVSQSVLSYDEFSKILNEYIIGKDIEKNRKTLLGIDYSISEAVLGLKLITTDRKTKDRVKHIQGKPIVAMTKTVFSAICNFDDNTTESFDKIQIRIKSVELVNAINTFEDKDSYIQLSERWRTICWYLGGIVEYINKQNWMYQGKEISISSDPVDFFSPQAAVKNVQDQYVVAAGANKKLNKVSFSILYLNEENEELANDGEYDWVFSNDESWLFAFSSLCENYEQEWESNLSCIPMPNISDITTLLCAKSEDEFFDNLDNAKIDYNFDLLAFLDSKSQKHGNKEWISGFTKLGVTFIECCKSLCTDGFYSDLCRTNSAIALFIDSYTELGQQIAKTSFPENLLWIMDVYIHAFSIEPTCRPITAGEETNCCIIPPWHPAVLQKMSNQMVFLMDGFNEWWTEASALQNKINNEEVERIIEELEQLTQIQSAVDIFPTKNNQYFGTLGAFGCYCICGNSNINKSVRLRDVLHKEIVFDDDFQASAFTAMGAESLMLFDIIEKYVKAFPNTANSLSLTLIDPTELQPIIAAIYRHIIIQKDQLKEFQNTKISFTLNILVRPENRGGRNYLSYWADEFFSQDENVDIRIFLNEWETQEDLEKLLSDNIDILFFLDVLKVNSLNFIPNENNGHLTPTDCFFPIVFKPTPASRTSVKRKMELTQTQFAAATIHSQVVYFRTNSFAPKDDKEMLVVREASIDSDRKKLINMLHTKAFWVVCIDNGMDGALLRNTPSEDGDYNFIGFSTGKGSHGQYNLTITARKSIVMSFKDRFRKRLRSLFLWDEKTIDIASTICLSEAQKLDGISLLSAINPFDHNINEFMAYIVTSLQMKEDGINEGLSIVIHLDSYKHWFSRDAIIGDAENESRPDFLKLIAKLGNNGKIALSATVIECKIARYMNSEEHKNKAIGQVENGIARLSKLFDPNSKSLRRRYWYAQLYRALAFSQITFSDEKKEYSELTSQLRTILDGNFEIAWDGKAMCYWYDCSNEAEIKTVVSTLPHIEVNEVPQKVMQRILLNDFSREITFVKDIHIDEKDVDDLDDISEENENAEISTQNIGNDDKADQEQMGMAHKTDGVSRNISNIYYKGDSGETLNSEKLVAETNDQNDDYSKQIDNEGVPEFADTLDKQANRDDHSIKDAELSNIKVHLGKDRNGNEVNWDFGHPKLPNRHMLITGTSGQGKTYGIQVMLEELSKKGISAVIFDYTEGFRLDQLEPEFKSILGGKIHQKIVYWDGIPINPFKRHEIEIAGIKNPEKISDVAQRIAHIFSHVFKFKEQQFSAIYESCRMGMEKHGDNMSMEYFRKELENSSNSAAKTVMSKMAPFFDSTSFNNDLDFDWDNIMHSNGTITIFQLTSFVRDIQVIITELMLWDAWHYIKKTGDKDNPFVVVLDEAQNLSHKENSPSAMILTEGRKFGWSAWFATQSLDILDDSEVVRLQQASFKMYFKPTSGELVRIAKQLDPTVPSGGAWVQNLKNLQKGQCIVVGDRVKPDGTYSPSKPVVTDVTSFSERYNNE